MQSLCWRLQWQLSDGKQRPWLHRDGYGNEKSMMHRFVLCGVFFVFQTTDMYRQVTRYDAVVLLLQEQAKVNAAEPSSRTHTVTSVAAAMGWKAKALATKVTTHVCQTSLNFFVSLFSHTSYLCSRKRKSESRWMSHQGSLVKGR